MSSKSWHRIVISLLVSVFITLNDIRYSLRLLDSKANVQKSTINYVMTNDLVFPFKKCKKILRYIPAETVTNNNDAPLHLL